MQPPVLGTVVPTVKYQVIEHPEVGPAKWKTVFVGPETPNSEVLARLAAGPSAFLWVREEGARHPVG